MKEDIEMYNYYYTVYPWDMEEARNFRTWDEANEYAEDVLQGHAKIICYIGRLDNV